MSRLATPSSDVQIGGEISSMKITKEIFIEAPIDISFESVLDQLGPAALGARDHRHTGGERFNHNIGKGIVQRRQSEHVGSAVVRLHVGLYAGENRPVTETERGCSASIGCDLLVAADDDRFEVRRRERFEIEKERRAVELVENRVDEGDDQAPQFFVRRETAVLDLVQ